MQLPSSRFGDSSSASASILRSAVGQILNFTIGLKAKLSSSSFVMSLFYLVKSSSSSTRSITDRMGQFFSRRTEVISALEKLPREKTIKGLSLGKGTLTGFSLSRIFWAEYFTSILLKNCPMDGTVRSAWSLERAWIDRKYKRTRKGNYNDYAAFYFIFAPTPVRNRNTIYTCLISFQRRDQTTINAGSIFL